MSEVFIRVNPKTNIVEYTHMFPFDSARGLNKTRTELLKEGYLVDTYPEPASIPGKQAIPYYNRATNEVYYKYNNTPMTTEERLELMESAFNDLLLSGIMGGNGDE